LVETSEREPDADHLVVSSSEIQISSKELSYQSFNESYGVEELIAEYGDRLAGESRWHRLD
jgi:hypothetical protein